MAQILNILMFHNNNLPYICEDCAANDQQHKERRKHFYNSRFPPEAAFKMFYNSAMHW